MSLTFIDKLKNTPATMNAEETIAIVTESLTAGRYVIVTSAMFEGNEFNEFVEKFISTWAVVRSSDGTEVPVYDPFAVGTGITSEEDGVKFWLGWYSNCVIFHTEENEEPFTWVFIEKETHDKILQLVDHLQHNEMNIDGS